MADIITKNIIIIGETKMKDLTFDKIEELTLIKDVRVREAGSEEVKLFKTGSTVKVKGNDKVQLLGSKAAVRKEEKKAPEFKK